eukprot:Phypoly_transcript_08266.p1 GENE.Phypoly_transcript_08266~~Phypoly_transcript_08266.p1  ORF type:complete len:467 (+),score=60.11 Phypoly_transcript_08266:66-1466(+)
MLAVNELRDPLIKQGGRVYTQRWLMLTLFVLVSTMQCTVWMTYMAVPDTSIKIYHISSDVISLLSAFGSIAFFPTIIHSTWAVEALGLRKSVLISMFLVTVGSVLRSFALKESLFFLVYIGQFLNSAAGPLVTILCPSLSAAWFSSEERTLATGIAATANSVGVPISFLIGLIVTDRKSFFYMIWGEGIFCVALFLVIIFFYKDKPPSPPSVSEQLTGQVQTQKPTVAKLLRDAGKVCRNINCLNIIFTTMLTNGTFSGWQSIMILIMAPLHYTQEQAQWAGFVSSTIGLLGAVVVKFHDKFHKGKFLFLLFYILSVVSFLFFTLMTRPFVIHFFRTPFWLITFAITLGTTVLTAEFPLGLEMLVELTYPMPKAVSAAVLSFAVSVITAIYLIFGDYVPLVWNSYLVTGSCIISVFVTFFLKEKYTRLQLDASQITVPPPEIFNNDEDEEETEEEAAESNEKTDLL